MVYISGYLSYSHCNFDWHYGIEQPRFIYCPWFECIIPNLAGNSQTIFG